MYNKHKYFKFNDKKVLHKVKKQWIIISLALLMAIGGEAIATHVSANANNTNNPGATTTIKSAIPRQQNSSNSLTSSIADITSQANSLHKSLVSTSSPTIHSLGTAGSNNIQTGTYQGLNYKYNPSNKSVEFTSGNLNWNGQNYIAFIGNNSINTPKNIQTASSVKFDDDITTNNLTSLNNLFWDNNYIKSVDFGNGFNTNHVNNMWGMLASDASLKYVTFGTKFNTQNVYNMSHMFSNDNYIHSISIQSPNTKLNNSISLQDDFYKTGSNIPNNFSQGNVGTFINKSFTGHVNNPNSDIKQEYPSLNDPIWRQNFHYNNPLGQANDIEAIDPHYDNGKVNHYDIYHLWNPGFSGPRDEWYHVTTSDFSNFHSAYPDSLSIKNVAIPDTSYMADGQSRVEVSPSDNSPISWGQVASGSEISNRKANGSSWITGNDQWGNPVSPNAKLAFFATYVDANSNDGSYLAYANPDGKGGFKQFRPYQTTDVFDGTNANAGTEFRDPSISTFNNGNSLVAYVAGGYNKKVFVLTSNDAIHWTYRKDLDINVGNLPVFNVSNSIETPHLEIIKGQPILFFSAQHETNGFSQEAMDYATGHLDNGLFHLDNNSKSGMIDYGFDDYAGDFTRVNNYLVYLGWFGNWSYYTGSHIGGFTLPYIVNWNGHNIDMTPIEPSKPINPINTTNLQDIYPANSKVSVNLDQPTASFYINLARSNNDSNYVKFTFNNGVLTAKRNGSANHATNLTNSVNLGINKLSNIQFYLDNTSVEAYVPEAHKIMSILDFDNTRNTPYTLTSNTPAKINSYQFNIGQAPTLENVSNINSEYSAYKSELSKDWQALSGHSNGAINGSKSLLDNNFNDIQNEINKATSNSNWANSFKNDARQHVYIALANDSMNLAKTKLYQASLQLKKLNNMAMPYLDASAADARIANYYKNSISNSVASANQSKANSAASSADASIESSIANSYAKSANSSIASSYRNSENVANQSKANSAASSADKSIANSVSNSVSKANQNAANSAAKSADKSIANSIAANESASISNRNNFIANSAAKSEDNSIANSYKNSISNSISAVNQSKAKSAASSADNSIDNSIAHSAAKSADHGINNSIASSMVKSADNSIINSYKNSISTSVNSANSSKASSAAKSADNSIAASYSNSVSNSVSVANQSKANSAAQSADQSIKNSEVHKASSKNAILNSQPSNPVIPNSTPINPIPFIPSVPNVPTTPSISSASNMNGGSASNIPSSISNSNNIIHTPVKPTNKKVTNNFISLKGLANHVYLYSGKHVIRFSHKSLTKKAYVLKSVQKGHYITYSIKINHKKGYVYGYIRKLAKPLFMNKKVAYLHIGKHTLKIHSKKIRKAKVTKAVRYARSNYIKYSVKLGHKHGVIYGALPKVAKVNPSKNVYNKYYQVVPRRYHYVKVIKPLMIYDNKRFTRHTHRGNMRKGITVRVKQLVKNGGITRFKLMNGRYITGLKKYVKLIK